MSHQESWVERQIREATERGEFDDLPGAGKPLDLGDPNDPDWWIKRVMKREQLDTADALPSVLALRREAATYPEALLDLGSADGVREVIRDYNRRVVEDRRRPVFGRDSPVVAPRLDVEETVARWEALRAARREAPPPAAPAAEPVSEAVPWWRRPWSRRRAARRSVRAPESPEPPDGPGSSRGP